MYENINLVPGLLAFLISERRRCEGKTPWERGCENIKENLGDKNLLLFFNYDKLFSFLLLLNQLE